MKTMGYALLAMLSLASVFLVAAIADNSNARDKELDQIIQGLIYRTREVGDQSNEEMLISLIQNKKATSEEIEDVLLKYLAGKGEPVEQYFDKNSLKSNSILFLGYVKSKRALPILKEMLVESNDERIKYSCALSIIKIEDGSLSFMNDIFNGKLLPVDFKYRHSLFEKVRERLNAEIGNTRPDEPLINKLKGLLIKYTLNVDESDGIVMRNDMYLSSIDKNYANSSTRKVMLGERVDRAETRNVKVWNEYFTGELRKLKAAAGAGDPDQE